MQIRCQHCGTKITAPTLAATTIQVPTPAMTALLGDQRAVTDLIEQLYRGDAQASDALFARGLPIMSALVNSLREESLETPNLTKGADDVTDILVRFGPPCVALLLTRLGKSRHAYLALGRIGSEQAVNGLLRELSSCNWRRAELACTALGLVEKPCGAKAIAPIGALRSSTRSGEVFLASTNALVALQSRFSPPAAGNSAVPATPA
jgi:hypothetical protein